MTTKKAPEGPKADKQLEAVIKKWRESYPMFKQFERICDDAKEKVEAAIIASGENHIVSKLGVFELATSERLDHKMFKELVIQLLATSANMDREKATEKVEALEVLSKKESKPYTQAQRGWAADTKAAKVAA